MKGDCLELMEDLEDGSVDMILCDLPYGTTACKWDTIIPFEPLWEQYKRIIKDNGAIVLFGSQPFTSSLIMSNLRMFKYTWVWQKSKATGYLNSKRMPLREHEDICVFYKKPPCYNPQMTKGEPYNKGAGIKPTDVYGKQTWHENKNDSGYRYPKTVQYFKTAESEGRTMHPTQKPIALLEYLIKTYTNEHEVILDNTMGSGSTGIACLNTNRRFIGMELEQEYFEIATKRIKEHTQHEQVEQHEQHEQQVEEDNLFNRLLKGE
jgi:site-specific DNA-methyltransferase (adenine-specific)